MSALALIKIQQELECIGQNADGLLVPIPYPKPDTIPRLFIAQHQEGYATYFRYDLPAHLRQQLSVFPPETGFHDPKTVERILATDTPATKSSPAKAAPSRTPSPLPTTPM